MSGKPETADMVARFSTQVRTVGSHFASISSLSEVSEYVTKMVATAGAKRVLVSSELTHFFASSHKLPFEVASSRNMSRVAYFETLHTADIGVSIANLGIAETGTLIIATSDESERLITALPAIHVVVLPLSKLVFSLEEAATQTSQLLTKNSSGLSISLISASSRTSDVGGITILGAHGPKELHVLLLNENLAEDI